MPIPTELVGSLPRPMKLQEAYADYDEGKISYEDLIGAHQVVEFVPGELRDMAIVLRAVSGGESMPDSLVEAVHPSFPDEWSPAMLRTHVSGLVARLVEMSLLRRRWEGRNVLYETTQPTNELLAASLEVAQ